MHKSSMCCMWCRCRARTQYIGLSPLSAVALAAGCPGALGAPRAAPCTTGTQAIIAGDVKHDVLSLNHILGSQRSAPSIFIVAHLLVDCRRASVGVCASVCAVNVAQAAFVQLRGRTNEERSHLIRSGRPTARPSAVRGAPAAPPPPPCCGQATRCHRCPPSCLQAAGAGMRLSVEAASQATRAETRHSCWRASCRSGVWGLGQLVRVTASLPLTAVSHSRKTPGAAADACIHLYAGPSAAAHNLEAALQHQASSPL